MQETMQAQAKSHKDLIVWQKAVRFVTCVYKLSDSFPQKEQFGLTNQMRRAAVSIASNIAEGRNRGTGKDFVHFLRMAYGSAAELETQLLISRNLRFTPRMASEVDVLLDEVSKMLRAMIQKLG